MVLLGHISLFNLSNQHLADFRDEQLQLVGPTAVAHHLSLLSKALKTMAHYGRLNVAVMTGYSAGA
ncbi:hypothetical protein LH51_04425 [Nitrincola sp. A-D6]|nr:hypothetical protein LH51_04425 [Nitrincola sp. A-D6]